MQCCGLLTVLVVATLLGLAAFALGDMLHKETTQHVYMFTTTHHEVHAIHNHRSGAYFLMSKVCVDTNTLSNGDIEYVLFTSDYRKVEDGKPLKFKFNRTADKNSGQKLFFFYFLKDSIINVTDLVGSSDKKIRFAKSDVKATTLCNGHCSDHDDSVDGRNLKKSGYYCVCINPKGDSPVNFTLDITEEYNHIEAGFRKECNDTEYDKNGRPVRKCCNFGFADSFLRSGSNVAYLTARNENLTLLTPDNIIRRVDVHIRYNDPVKTLTAVILVLVVLIGLPCVVMVSCVRIKCTDPPPQQ